MPNSFDPLRGSTMPLPLTPETQQVDSMRRGTLDLSQHSARPPLVLG